MLLCILRKHASKHDQGEGIMAWNGGIMNKYNGLRVYIIYLIRTWMVYAKLVPSGSMQKSCHARTVPGFLFRFWTGGPPSWASFGSHFPYATPLQNDPLPKEFNDLYNLLISLIFMRVDGGAGIVLYKWYIQWVECSIIETGRDCMGYLRKGRQATGTLSILLDRTFVTELDSIWGVSKHGPAFPSFPVFPMLEIEYDEIHCSV